MKFNKLNKNIISYWKVKNILDFLITFIIFGIFTFIIFVNNYLTEFFNIIVILESIILLVQALCIFITPKIKYNWWGYFLDDDKFAIRKGFIFIKTTVIPMLRIQHVSLEHGPILRKYKLNIIKISTASGIFEIEGLTDEEAGNIITYLKKKLIKNNGKELKK